MRYTLQGLGSVVREARLAKGMSQGELGAAAGYGSGAGVSVSRIEGGLTRPGPERFAGLAVALDMTPGQLEAAAAQRSDSLSAGLSEPPAGHSEERLKDRVRRIHLELQHRTTVVTELGDSFNDAHDRARDGFFMPFVRMASDIDGAPQPEPDELDEESGGDVEARAALRLRVTSHSLTQLLAGGAGGAAAGAAVGGAVAYVTFVAAASLGTASTGVAIAGLSGAAATSATLALLGGGSLAAGGAGVAGGTTLLTTIVAAPALILALGGLVWMVKRNRKQQQELAAQLDEVEASLASSSRGFEALKDVLPRATELLDYIATHAGHALQRWEPGLGPGPLAWSELGLDDQKRYQDFVDIAAAQLAVVTINVQDLMAGRGDERELLIELADQVLSQADTRVRSLV